MNMVPDSISLFKYLMFGINFILAICGIAMISVGGITLHNGFSEFFHGNYTSAPVLLVVIGVFIFPIAFLGCYGAIKENRYMVMTFGFLMAVLFIATLAGGITGYTYNKNLDNLLRNGMVESFDTQQTTHLKIWDDIQIRFHCCGVTGPNDYLQLPIEFPSSCCQDPNGYICVPNTDGCYKIVLKEMKKNISQIGGCGIGVAVIGLFGCIIAGCLVYAIKRKNYEGM